MLCVQWSLVYLFIYYLRQVNGVNGGGTVFVRCVSVCVRVRSLFIHLFIYNKGRIRVFDIIIVHQSVVIIMIKGKLKSKKKTKQSFSDYYVYCATQAERFF